MSPSQSDFPPLISPVITSVRVMEMRPSCKLCHRHHHLATDRSHQHEPGERHWRKHKKEEKAAGDAKVQNDADIIKGGEMDRDRNSRKASSSADVYRSSNGWSSYDSSSNGSRPYIANNNNAYPSSQWADQDGPAGRLSTTAGHPDGGEKAINGSGTGKTVIVRGEEIGIVVVVLLLWVGAIILFFNRWGKIRMLEPYQPKFCEDHRQSCPMADVTSIQQYPRTFSKCNIATDLIGSPHFAKCNYHGVSSYGLGTSMGVNRPRQNSVFVTSPHAVAMASHSSILHKASRKTKSAIDLSTLVLSEEFLENDEDNEKEDSEEEEQEQIPLKPIIKKKTSIV